MPTGLQWLSYLAGSAWPKGDEDRLFALAEHWHAAATDLHELVEDVHTACTTALANYSGSGADSMKSQFDAFFTGDQSVDTLAQALRQLGDSVKDCGTQIEYSKLQIITTLAIIAAEIAWALTTLWGSFMVPAIETEAVGIMQTIGRWLTTRLAAHAEKVAAMPLWRLAGMEALKQTGIGFVQDLSIQAYQDSKGHRDGIDWKQTLTTAAAAGVSALVATPVGHYVGAGLGNWAGRDSMTWWKSGAIGVATAIPAGLAGSGAGIVANGVLTGQWEFDPAALLGGVGGGLAGGVHGVLGHIGHSRLAGLGDGYSDGSAEKSLEPTSGLPTSRSEGADSFDEKANSASGFSPSSRRSPTSSRAEGVSETLPTRTATPSSGRNDVSRGGSAAANTSDGRPPAARPDAGTNSTASKSTDAPHTRIAADHRVSPATHHSVEQDRPPRPAHSQQGPLDDKVRVPAPPQAHPVDDRHLDGEEHLNDCAPLALRGVVALTGSDAIRFPDRPVGRSGMSARELENAAGAPLRRFGDHNDIAEQLRGPGFGDGSVALVVDTYRGPTDEHGVGAHAYLLRNVGGDVRAVDPITGMERPLASVTPVNVSATHAVLYTATGRPHLVPTDSPTGAADFGTVRIGTNRADNPSADVEFRMGTADPVSSRDNQEPLMPRDKPAADPARNAESSSRSGKKHNPLPAREQPKAGKAPSPAPHAAVRGRESSPVVHRDSTPADMSAVRKGKQQNNGEQPEIPPDDPARQIPAVTITPPPEELSAPVRDFATRRDGSQPLNHITPIPQETVEWLHKQVFRMVEGDRGPDEKFRAEVRKVLTAPLLSGENQWVRLRSESGMPLRVKYKGRSYPISLRLSLRAIGPSKEQIAPMPDGPPVGIQRWAFGIPDTGDNAADTTVRTLSYAYSHTWDTDRGPLNSVTLTPEVDLARDQLTPGASVGATVQPMTIVRSKGRSRPFDYETVWEMRPGTGMGEWRPTTDDAPNRLLVWFPDYLAKAGALPTIAPDHPTAPAPLPRLREDVPLYGVLSIPNHDRILADVMASFSTPLRDISDSSGEQLREFFSEGNLRGNIPLSWDGSVDSPTLYTASGKAIGFLRVTTDLHGGTEITGPTTEKTVLESYVLRSLRSLGSSTITKLFGGAVSLGFGFGAKHADPVTGTASRGGQFTVKGGASQQFSHTLNYGDSARTAHSLRTAEPLQQVRPDMTVRVTLVRPDGHPVEPAAHSPLAGGHDYPIEMLVPMNQTLGHAPTETRYLPPEILHMQHLGVSTTPLRVDGIDPLLTHAGQWLSDNGFFPSDRDDPSPLDAATQEATHTQLLNNVRKFAQMANRMGRRSELDEMIEDGATTWFNLPTPTGTRRVAITLTAERLYDTPADPHQGPTHDWTLPKVQTLNYTGSTIAGDEQFSSSPFEWNVGANGSVTNPLDRTGSNLGLQSVTPLDYTYSGQSATIRGSSSGTGHEYYTLSPTENGTQVFTVPVRYRMRIDYSHGDNPAPVTSRGSVRLAVPTYRTLTDKPTDSAEPAPTVVRDLTDRDTRNLTLPSTGRTTEHGVLRLPETALLDRVAGSKQLRKIIRHLLNTTTPGPAPAQHDDPPVPHASRNDPTRSEQPARGPVTEHAARTQDEIPDTDWDIPHMPGGFPHDPQEFELPLWNTRTNTAAQTNTTRVQAHSNTAQPSTAERQADPEAMWSVASEVIHNGFSPHHLNANALRMFRDSYVREIPGTGTAVEVTGYLTKVKVLPQPPKMDGERWLQSVNASAHSESSQRGHQVGGAMAGSFGDADYSFIPEGDYHTNTSTTTSTTANDNTTAFRVTTEDTTPVHRFSATAHYVVTVRGPHGDRTRVIEVPDATEFLLVDNDLHNHPDLLALVYATDVTTGGRHEVSEPNTPDRGLPTSYTTSGGLVSGGVVTDVDLAGGRKALQDEARRLVEEHVPGITTPGSKNYLPGVLTRINEHTTTLGLRTLPNAGPAGRTAFHFIDRRFRDPRTGLIMRQLVEVSFNARPDSTRPWSTTLGKRVSTTSGLDNILGHSTGDGSTLNGATRTSTTRQRGHKLNFAPGGKFKGHRLEFNLTHQRQNIHTEFHNSGRELRAWQRSLGNTTEFSVPYQYTVEVSSRIIPEQTLLGSLIRHGVQGLTRAGQLLGIPSLLNVAPLSEPLNLSRGSRDAQVRVRFNTSETSPDDTVTTRTAPAIYQSDPTLARPNPAPGDVAIETERTPQVQTLLAGPSRKPARPFAIYEFNGADQLAHALRLVDPSLDTPAHALGNYSSEGIFTRLTALVKSGRITLQGPAATAAFLGATTSGTRGNRPDLTPNTDNGRGAPTSIAVTLYSPRPEKTSKDTAIDHIESASDGVGTQADNIVFNTANVSLNNPYTTNGDNRGTFTALPYGKRADVGQSGTISSNRRAVLRFGTPAQGTDGSGTTGHRARALGLFEIRGPEGTLWVTGDVLFRTTETLWDEKPTPTPHEETIDTAGQRKPSRDSQIHTDGTAATDDPARTFTDEVDQAFNIVFQPLPDNWRQRPSNPPPPMSSPPRSRTAPARISRVASGAAAALPDIPFRLPRAPRRRT